MSGHPTHDTAAAATAAAIMTVIPTIGNGSLTCAVLNATTPMFIRRLPRRLGPVQQIPESREAAPTRLAHESGARRWPADAPAGCEAIIV
ncbi:hypothetical protein ABIC28_003390 [Rhodococcus sp. PvR044]